MPPPVRRAARVIPVSPDGACLLLLESDPARPEEPTWGTIGGGVDADEDLAEAAVRELREETGIIASVADLSPPIARRVVEFSWNDVPRLGDSTVFALPVSGRVPVTFAHLEPEEIDTVLDARWLTPEEVVEDGRLMWPDLPDIMRSAIAASVRP
jgi:8-oxo-dGTP pyrophosphatase MutT (NUDIX family)